MNHNPNRQSGTEEAPLLPPPSPPKRINRFQAVIDFHDRLRAADRARQTNALPVSKAPAIQSNNGFAEHQADRRITKSALVSSASVSATKDAVQSINNSTDKNFSADRRQLLTGAEFLAESVIAEAHRRRAEEIDQRLARENRALTSRSAAADSACRFVWTSPVKSLPLEEIAGFFDQVVMPAVEQIIEALGSLPHLKITRMRCKRTCGFDIYEPAVQIKSPGLAAPARRTIFRVKLSDYHPLTVELKTFDNDAEHLFVRHPVILFNEQFNLEAYPRLTGDYLIRSFAENFFIRRTHPARAQLAEIENARRDRHLIGLEKTINRLRSKLTPEAFIEELWEDN